MSGAQNFNEPGRAPRYGGGHITSQQGPLPLLEKIRFSPLYDPIVNAGKSGAAAIGNAGRTAIDHYKGSMKTGAVNSPYSGERRVPISSSMAEQEALEAARRLHSRAGGMDPAVARSESRLAAMEREVAQRPTADWMERALKTGEIARDKELPWAGYREAPMERLYSIGKPMSEEQIALSRLTPKGSLVQRLQSILAERGASRTAARAAMRR